MLSRVWAWAFLGVMIVFFVIAVPLVSSGAVNFLTLRNSQNILVAITPVLLLGLGQTFVIISAGIDLSVGWVMSLASVPHWRSGLRTTAARRCFAAGPGSRPRLPARSGFINGVIIAKLKVPAFIVTLGSSFIVRGVSLLMSENTTVIGLPAGIAITATTRSSTTSGARAAACTLPTRPEVTGDLCVAWTRSCPTRWCSPRSWWRSRSSSCARPGSAGTPTPSAAIRGGAAHRHPGRPAHHPAVHAVRLHRGHCRLPLDPALTAGSAVIGDPLLLASIAAVIIGGVSLFGGAGTVMGTVIGALIIAVLTTGLVMLNVEAFWQFIVVGAVVIIAVLIDQSRDLIIGRGRTG